MKSSVKFSVPHFAKMPGRHCFYGAMVLATMPAWVSAQTPLSDIDITGARPLKDALFTIEMKLKVPISFEQGPPLADELVSGKDIGLRSDRMYPRSYSLSIHFVPGEKNALAAIQTAVAAHARAGLPGNFVVSQQAGAILVKPQTEALSDLSITIPDGERTPDQTAELIAQELAKVSGKPVTFLSQPWTSVKSMKFSASNRTLSETLTKWNTLGPTSFLLIDDPLSKAYCLSFVAVPRDLSNE